MNILFIVPYPVDCAPSQRLKFEQHLGYLKRNGIKCTVRPFMSQRFYNIVYKEGMLLKKIGFTLLCYIKRIFTLFEAVRSDIVYLHLEASPFGPPVFECFLKFIKKKIIYDIDDAIFMPNYNQVNRIVKLLDDPNKVFKIFQFSSHIIVVTNYLKKRALAYNSNVTYIPPTIDTDKYHPKADYNKKGVVCIGWSGSRTSSIYLKLLDNVLRVISKKYDVRIKVIGNTDFKIEGISNFTSMDWCRETEVEDLQEIDIGLYPLPKNEWVLGKGGLKALQYMGMGIPVVCSDIGACTEFIDDGINGYLVDSDDEWVDKISMFVESHELRKKIGLAGRKTVEDKFSVKANSIKYLETINKVYYYRAMEG